MSPEDQRWLAEEVTAAIDRGVPADEVERVVTGFLRGVPDDDPFIVFVVVGRLRWLAPVA